MIVASSAIGAFALGFNLLALYQLSSYRWSVSRRVVAELIAVWAIALVVAAIALVLTVLDANLAYWCASALALVAACVYCAVRRSKFVKTPPRFTARFVRLNCIFAACCCAAGGACLFASEWSFAPVLVGAEYALSPIIAILASAIALPIEKVVAAAYLSKCRAKLKSCSPLVVGVTGSFGKTGVKNYLVEMLRERYVAECTPKSYNTPMGVCIGVRDMPVTTQIFVVEMGARRVGDIARLCRLTNPSVAVVTGVAAQHLATFGSEEAIYKTKMELPSYVSARGGKCYFNADNSGSARMCGEIGGISSGERGDVAVRQLKTDEDGSEFYLEIGGERVRIRTRLLGIANVQNVALAAAVAYGLGVTPTEIARAAARLTPIEHRMYPTRTASGLTIIDDSYNANPIGADLAIQTLSYFDGKKAVFTQGVVEGGRAQGEINVRLGRKIAKIADCVILTGVNAAHIKRGLQEERYDGSIYVVRDLDGAKKVFATELGGYSVLLIQNDLTDAF